MRRLLERVHYGTACPTVDHTPEIMRNLLALFLRTDKISITPFLI